MAIYGRDFAHAMGVIAVKRLTSARGLKGISAIFLLLQLFLLGSLFLWSNQCPENAQGTACMMPIDILINYSKLILGDRVSHQVTKIVFNKQNMQQVF